MSITLMALAAAAVGNPDVVVGRWRTETRGGIIEIARCGPSICGKIVTSDGLATNPNLMDVNNKAPKLRNRPVKGLQMLSGFSYKDGIWDGGTIYTGEDGKTYSARISPIDANTLKLRGCIFVPLCKNQTWTRVR